MSVVPLRQGNGCSLTVPKMYSMKGGRSLAVRLYYPFHIPYIIPILVVTSSMVHVLNSGWKHGNEIIRPRVHLRTTRNVKIDVIVHATQDCKDAHSKLKDVRAKASRKPRAQGKRARPCGEEERGAQGMRRRTLREANIQRFESVEASFKRLETQVGQLATQVGEIAQHVDVHGRAHMHECIADGQEALQTRAQGVRGMHHDTRDCADAHICAHDSTGNSRARTCARRTQSHQLYQPRKTAWTRTTSSRTRTQKAGAQATHTRQARKAVRRGRARRARHAHEDTERHAPLLSQSNNEAN
ncbi:hypothetical protein DH2020_022256 [Rehmannia glutinosa]|uniref:t-SNARE coiled-coil homology domain-containing protein n=1 Tax=Rehmannia glutinosa TaxID=99300 RepID=A0ABR0WF35_REHGL